MRQGGWTSPACDLQALHSHSQQRKVHTTRGGHLPRAWGRTTLDKWKREGLGKAGGKGGKLPEVAQGGLGREASGKKIPSRRRGSYAPSHSEG